MYHTRALRLQQTHQNRECRSTQVYNLVPLTLRGLLTLVQNIFINKILIYLLVKKVIVYNSFGEHKMYMWDRQKFMVQNYTSFCLFYWKEEIILFYFYPLFHQLKLNATQNSYQKYKKFMNCQAGLKLAQISMLNLLEFQKQCSVTQLKVKHCMEMFNFQLCP